MSLAVRRAECERVLAKHPNALPVVLVGPAKKRNTVALAPSATVADIDAAVRELGTFNPRKSVALTVDGCSPAANTTLADLYAACRSEDGFLYVGYGKENKLGMAFAGPCMAGTTGSGGGSGTVTNDGTGLDNAYGGYEDSGFVTYN